MSAKIVNSGRLPLLYYNSFFILLVLTFHPMWHFSILRPAVYLLFYGDLWHITPAVYLGQNGEISPAVYLGKFGKYRLLCTWEIRKISPAVYLGNLEKYRLLCTWENSEKYRLLCTWEKSKYPIRRPCCVHLILRYIRIKVTDSQLVRLSLPPLVI